MCYCLEGPYNYLELTQVRYPVQAKVGLLKRRGIKQCKSLNEIQEDKISKYIVPISLSKLDRQLSVDFLICFPSSRLSTKLNAIARKTFKDPVMVTIGTFAI